MRNHIIVGYGKWGQIIFNAIKNFNFLIKYILNQTQKITYIKIISYTLKVILN